jgi:hypothetical protein
MEEYVNTFFSNPVACCFLYKAKDLSAPRIHYKLNKPRAVRDDDDVLQHSLQLEYN